MRAELAAVRVIEFRQRRDGVFSLLKDSFSNDFVELLGSEIGPMFESIPDFRLLFFVSEDTGDEFF